MILSIIGIAMKFDEKVWNIMKKIPKGKVTTYKEVAHALNTKAYRAVGNACGRNPYAPAVPCHRVISTSGDIGGFTGNLKDKIKLLESEGIRIKNNKIMDLEKVLFKFSKN